MKIYLAGPMRGYPEFNAQAFRDGAAQLRSAGHEVFSPLDHDEQQGFDFSGTAGSDEDLVSLGFDLRSALGADLAWICAEADMVMVLPGWEDSRGARAEVAVAQALGLPVAGFVAGGGFEPPTSGV